MVIRSDCSLLLGLAVLAFVSCAGVAAETETAAPTAEPYAPGLGDFMTAYVQPHHIKLWLAGNVGNWKLAAYEADELSVRVPRHDGHDSGLMADSIPE
jgi:hypothetical protein